MQYVIICIALFRAAIRIITYCNTYRKTYRKWPLFGVDSPPLGVDSPPFGVANGDLAFFGVRLARFGVANAALPDSAISSLLGVANSQPVMLRGAMADTASTGEGLGSPDNATPLEPPRGGFPWQLALCDVFYVKKLPVLTQKSVTLAWQYLSLINSRIFA